MQKQRLSLETMPVRNFITVGTELNNHQWMDIGLLMVTSFPSHSIIWFLIIGMRSPLLGSFVPLGFQFNVPIQQSWMLALTH